MLKIYGNSGVSITSKIMRKGNYLFIAAAALMVAAINVRADVSVAWTSPPNNSVYPVGTIVTPIGQASASGIVGGTGLDLALVLDSSGSMGIMESGKTRQQWQKEAAIALVNGLPQDSTSVAVIEFDSDANTIKVLTPLNPSKADVIAAINSVDASGGTTIGAGIDKAAAELTGINHTAGRSQVMVVVSDGDSSGTPGENSDAAVTLGVDQIHSVGIPGHSALTMQRIVDGPDDSYGASSDNYGTYTGFDSGDDLNNLIALFSGTGGNLVGIAKVEVTDPNGNTVVVPTDALGNFSAPAWAIKAGAQTWQAKAYDTAGNTDTDNLTLYGQATGVPDGGSTLGLLGIGLLALGRISSRRNN